MNTEKEIRKARAALLRGRPEGRGAFFGQLAMRLELQADHRLQTRLSTNGTTIHYNPEIISASRPEKILASLAEAVVHCVSGHHVRRGHRDEKLWNIACDQAILPELIQAGFAVDGTPDPRFAGMGAERIYTMMEQDPSQGGKKGKKSPSGGGGADVSDMPGKSPCEEGEEGEGQGQPTAAQREKELRSWVVAAAEAAASVNQGRLPAFARRFIAELMRPKVDPWALLREYVKETMKSDYSWIPPSRRFVSQGLYLPGIRSDDQLGHIVVMIDTSGSIDNATLQEFGNHIKAIAEDYRPKSLTVIYADAAVNHVDRFDNPDEVFVKPHGGGGTDFRPAFNHIAKLEEEPVVAVYLTDCYGAFPDKAPSYPTIWACITDVVAPWGITLHIKV